MDKLEIQSHTFHNREKLQNKNAPYRVQDSYLITDAESLYQSFFLINIPTGMQSAFVVLIWLDFQYLRPCQDLIFDIDNCTETYLNYVF